MTNYRPPAPPEPPRDITLDDLSKRHPQVERDLPPGSLEVDEVPDPPTRLSRLAAIATAQCGNALLAVFVGIVTLWVVHYFGLDPEVIFGNASATPIIPIEPPPK